MKKATTKNKAKATTKATSKSAAKKTPAKKPAAKKTEPAKSDKMEKLNKLERALAENQISRDEYDMWREVYAKETPFNPNIIVEEDYRPRKTRRRSY
jgi:hypothetical protein